MSDLAVSKHFCKVFPGVFFLAKYNETGYHLGFIWVQRVEILHKLLCTIIAKWHHFCSSQAEVMKCRAAC